MDKLAIDIVELIADALEACEEAFDELACADDRTTQNSSVTVERCVRDLRSRTQALRSTEDDMSSPHSSES